MTLKKNEKNIVISYETIVTILLPSLIDVLKRKGPMVRAKKTYSRNTHPVVIASSKWFLNWHLLIFKNWLRPLLILSIALLPAIGRYPLALNCGNSFGSSACVCLCVCFISSSALSSSPLCNPNHSAVSICMLTACYTS